MSEEERNRLFMKRIIRAIFSYILFGTRKMHQKIIRINGKFQFISDDVA
jgi:RNase P protein component